MKTTRIRDSGAFRPGHPNMMTPLLIEYRKGNLNGETVHIELSEGYSNISKRDLIGVTFRNYKGERLNPDPSKCFYSMEEVEAYLESL